MLSQFISPAHLPFTMAMLLMVLAAVWRGGPEERRAANALTIAWLLSKLLFRYQGFQTEWGVLAVDAALLAVLVWTALRSPRHWPLFAAGFHLLTLVTHLARTLDPRVGGWAYLTAQVLWGYLVVGAVIYGAWTAPAHRRAAEAV